LPTMVMAKHADVKTVSAILGYANATMILNVYADNTKRESMEALDRVLAGA